MSPEHGAQTSTPATGVPASVIGCAGPRTLVTTIDAFAVKYSISRASTSVGARPITSRMP